MLNSPKENAEHDMLVDLARNDLGRICKAGSIKILREKYGKKFANLQHLVSDIEGEVDKNINVVDFFANIFPAGTLTGAPKIRTMENIAQTEKGSRGLYGGAVGYFSQENNGELAIGIRSFSLQNGVVNFRTGCGIVADSTAKEEWLEIHNKAKNLVKIFNYLR